MAQNYVLLDRIELNASAASVTFSNIPQTGYTDLKIVLSARCDTASVQQVVTMKVNSLTSGYADKYLYGSGSAAGSGSYSTSIAFIGDTPSANATANTFGSQEIYIPNYTSSNAKSWSVDSVAETNSTTAYMELTAGYNSTTSAISNIVLAPSSGNFISGSTFSLYGVAAYGTTPTVAPKADGGNVIATDGTYWYHAFLSSGTFTPTTNLSADVLVVAGGGGGGSSIAYYGGGGGGAGGFKALTSQSLNSGTSYTCTVGAGGAGGSAGSSVNGTNGGSSSFNGTSTTGGGGGAYGSSSPTNGSAGGSGGGAANNGGTGGTGVSGEGYAGGNSSGNSKGAGGGGSTAAAPAANTAGLGGNGGTGNSSYSSWATATNTGSSNAYAGGGGGGGYTGNTVATGSAGGGNGGVANAGSNAVANTGSGGGGAGNDAGQYNGGNGASGIIIIRYAV